MLTFKQVSHSGEAHSIQRLVLLHIPAAGGSSALVRPRVSSSPHTGVPSFNTFLFFQSASSTQFSIFIRLVIKSNEAGFGGHRKQELRQGKVFLKETAPCFKGIYSLL